MKKLIKQIQKLKETSEKYVALKGEAFKVKASEIEYSVNVFDDSISLYGSNNRDIEASIKINFNGSIRFELFDKNQRKYMYPWSFNTETNTIPKNVLKILVPFLAQINQLIETRLHKRTNLLDYEIEAQLKAWIYAKKEVEPW